MMAGKWNTTISVRQNGKEIGQKKVAVTAKEISAALKLPQATTYRLLNLLVGEEYLVRLPDLRGFALGRRAARLALPVVTTPHAKGVFPESDPLHLGLIGLGGHTSAISYLMSRPDVVCIVGSRLGDLPTDGWALPLAGTDATIQIQLGQAAQSAGDTATAAAAFKQFLKLAPTDPLAPQVKSALKGLKAQAGVSTSSGSSG